MGIKMKEKRLAMNAEQGSRMSDILLPRRSFLMMTGVATTAGLLGFTQGGSLAYALGMSKAERDRIGPDEIIARAKKRQ
jgi:hypothetical protein